MIFYLDGEKMRGRQGVHEHIKEVLGLPEFYGKNLDALYDVLTDLQGEVVIRNFHEMEENLGSYAGAVMKTFVDASAANPEMKVRVE